MEKRHRGTMIVKKEIKAIEHVVLTGEGLSFSQKLRWKDTKYRDMLIINLLIYCDIKLTEIQRLNVSSFDLERGIVNVNNGKGIMPEIPINQIVKDSFIEYLEHERLKAKPIAVNHEDALLLSSYADVPESRWKKKPSGLKRLEIPQMTKMVKKYTAAALGELGVGSKKLNTMMAAIRICGTK